jgi:Ca2+-binding RTX toxin-like protein
VLNGKDGADLLYGGGGVDFLDGGAGADTYVYLSITDSGKTRATRDVISTFVSGSDKINLSGIDANTATKVDDPFHLLARNTGFTKAAGELRVVDEVGHSIIQGDVNGDGKADFTIDVVGTVTIASGDFVL